MFAFLDYSFYLLDKNVSIYLIVSITLVRY